MKRILPVIIVLSLAISTFSQQVNTMISTGLDQSRYCAISQNNKYVAKLSKAKATIWDFKTGRLVREILFTTTDFSNSYTESVPDSIVFSKDEKLVYIGKTKAKYPTKGVTEPFKMLEVNIESGLINVLESNIKSVLDKDSLFVQLVMKLRKTNEPLSFFSPDRKAEIVYQNTMTDSTRLYHNIFIKKGNMISDILGHAVFINFVFSNDSRYVFAGEFIYDLLLNRKVCDLKSVPFAPAGCGFISKANIPYTAAKNEIIIWDFPNIKLIKTPDLAGLTASSNGEYLACQTSDAGFKQGEWYIINLSTGKRIGVVKQLNTNETESVLSISDDGKFLITGSSKGKKLFNTITGELIRQFPEFDFSCTSFFIKNNEILNQQYNNVGGLTSTKYNIEKNEIENYDLKKALRLEEKTRISGIAYDKNHILVMTNFHVAAKSFTNVYLLNAETNIVIDTIASTEIPLGTYGLKMSNDSKYLATTKNGSIILLYNRLTKKSIELKGHNSFIVNYCFSNDNKNFITSSIDGRSKYWDVETGKELASIISTGYQEYVITTPEQYYMSTKGATEYVHFVKGNNLYGVEQFDLKYNRPDIVLKKMGLGNEKVKEAYHKAYLKRLKKMKLTEDMLSDELNLPEVKITNAQQITASMDADELKLNLSIADKKYKLDRINIWINDVALYGANGISLKSMNTLNYENSIALKLKKGINKIQVSTLNVAGAESYKETVTVNCTKGKEKPDLYLLTIGAGEFAQNQFNLTYAAKDAKDMSEAFKANKNYGNVFTKTLTNKEVTRSNVIKLKELLKTADRNDEVILFYAGHGVLDKNLDYYLSTGDMNFTNPSVNGITYETLESILDSIAPLKKVLFIDACHSGEIDKEEVQDASFQNSNSGITFRSVGSTIAQKETYLGLDNTSELSKSLFTDLRRGTGATVISSAGGKEYAMESDAWKNGLFTYCLLHGLKDLAADTNKDGQIMLSELQQYLRDEVTNLSNGAQKPTSRIENLNMDFKIW